MTTVRRRRWPRVLAIGCLTPLLLLVVAGVVLAIWRPWVPTIVVSEPGAGGARLTTDGLLANYYAPKSDNTSAESAPGVLVFGGSEGGLSVEVTRQAQALHDKGFAVLALSYWGGQNQPQAMDALPLETFDKALTVLGSQHGVDRTRLAVVGTSKGGEAALLLGSRHPELKAVVGMVPSSVVWQGINLAEPWKMTSIGSTWSVDGKPLPYLPYGQAGVTDRYGAFAKGLENLSQHQDAIIAIEKSRAAVLLVCGESDTLWPSCPMSEQVATRAKAKNGPEVTVLSYPDAGHFGVGVPLEKGAAEDAEIAGFGGSLEGNQSARAQSWPKVVDHLAQALAS